MLKRALKTVLLCLVAGIILSFWGFLHPPEGEISSCVLYFFSEYLIYSGTIFSVKRHIKTYCRNARKEISFCICFRVRRLCSKMAIFGKCRRFGSQNRGFCELVNFSFTSRQEAGGFCLFHSSIPPRHIHKKKTCELAFTGLCSLMSRLDA